MQKGEEMENSLRNKLAELEQKNGRLIDELMAAKSAQPSHASAADAAVDGKTVTPLESPRDLVMGDEKHAKIVQHQVGSHLKHGD